MAGGAHNDSSVTPSAEVTSPEMCTGIFWTATGSMVTARHNFSMVLLANGDILAAGGTNVTNGANSQTPGALASAEIFSPATGLWTRTGSLRNARLTFLMVLLPSGNVLAAGGRDGTTLLTSAELYIPLTGLWSSTGSLTTPRFYSQIVSLANGNALVAGGIGTGVFLSSAEVYNSRTGMWSTTGSLTQNAGLFQMVLLPNGNVLAAGGLNSIDDTSYIEASTFAEIYDPSTGVWQDTGSLGTARYQFQMVLLPNGNVLAAGGVGNGKLNATLASAEVYNYKSATWTPTGSLATTRRDFQMVVLPSGNVLAAGGVNIMTEYLASVEFYNYTTGSWPATGTLMTARSDFQMAVF